MNTKTVTIKLENNTPKFNGREVILTSFQNALLFGKPTGEGLFIHIEDLKYKDEQDGE
jgi:hypothetical protein